MEDRIAFDLWGGVIPELKERALETIGDLRPELTRPAILRELILAPAPGRWTMIAQNLEWDTVRTLREQVITCFAHPQAYQAGYGPSDRDRLKECPVHRLFYGGVLGCPVCRD
jgi:hypothetical protein